ncbi:lipoyl synthase [Egibacter rhizosphaerae]|uniref:lipoyl synthase n=1 Tax=Egibacter rhizosphaerae TaxID=1670831 RepID=UPI00197AF4EE|nr:lipoyl synthase [Egibacter rhizosphaerae]
MTTSLIPEGATRLTVVGKPQIPERKPKWLKRDTPLAGANYREIKRTMRDLDLHTVCEEADCPNIHECWENREATFLIGGPDCTRRCGFCEIATGKPKEYDTEEPVRVAEAVEAMGLHFAVVTGVARDDLSDKAAWLYAETCRQIKQRLPHCGVELLIDDFRGDPDLLQLVLDAEPEVLAHNLETPRRLFRHVRPAFDYDGSLELLRGAKERSNSATKSNLMLGMGETEEEVIEAMRDLAGVGCDILTVNQYLQPTHKHLALQRYVTPEEFERYRAVGAELGFAHVESGPLVRSSYRAGEQAISAGVWRRPSGSLPSPVDA